MRLSKKEKIRILVTGATGPYGAYFAKLCIKLGHDVFSIEHTRRPNDSAILLKIKDKILWEHGDIRDTSLVARLLATRDIQAVAHFAALPLVRVSTLVTEPVFSVNVMGTVSILEAVRQVALSRPVNFLYVSTDKVYGNAGDNPYIEDTTPLLGSSVYESSKVAAEAVCRSYQFQNLVPNIVISRSCNVIAPIDTNWRLIPNTIRQFITKVPAKIFTSGQYVREYMHVEDAVEAQYELMIRAEEHKGQSFNIGSGYQFTQENIIDYIQSKHFIKGVTVRIPPPEYHKIEISYQKLNFNKIKKIIGWEPVRTPYSAIDESVAWWLKNKNLAPWSIL